MIDTFQKQSALNIFLFISVSQLLLGATGSHNNTNFYQFDSDGLDLLRLNKPLPSTLTECSCSTSFNCLMESTLLESLYCGKNYDYRFDSGTCLFPGFNNLCRDVDSLMICDLRCLFDQACVNALLFRNISASSTPSLPNSLLSSKPLNISELIVGSPMEPIGSIIRRLMIEDWSLQPDFDGYYKECAPDSCIYSLSVGSDSKYIVETIVGYFGLTIVFRLLIPVLVWLGNHFVFIIRGNRENNNRRFHLQQAAIYLRRDLIHINIFKTESRSQNEEINERMCVLATRMYLLLMIISIIALAIVTNRGQKISYKTVMTPSIETFQSLHEQYSATLSCPCQQISIPNYIFTNITARLNQICSSDFIQDNWIRLLHGYSSMGDGYTQSHRELLSRHFQILQWFCDLSQKIVDFILLLFKTSSFISLFILSRPLLESEVNNNLREQLQQNTAHFRRELDQTLRNIESMYVIGGFNNDWLPKFGNASNDYVIRNVPRLFPETRCNCAVSHDCSEPLMISPHNLTLPGLVIGCTPMRGLQMSTSECLYSSDCIANIVNYFIYQNESITHEINSGTDSSYTFRQLSNDSTLSTPQNASIGSLIDKFFVDQWVTDKSYEHYFNYCASKSCHYNYSVPHDVIDILTSIISFYGSLSIFWRFFAWRVIKVYRSHQLQQN